MLVGVPMARSMRPRISVSAKTALIAPLSDRPTSDARSTSAWSMTARMSSIRSSSDADSRVRSDRPVPRLSNQVTVQRPPRRRSVCAHPGNCQNSSTCDAVPVTQTTCGPVPNCW